MRDTCLLSVAHTYYGVAVLAAFLLGFAADCRAQTHKAAGAEPAFEVVSFKDAGTSLDHMAGDFSSKRRPLEFTGVRLRGDDGLFSFIEFAYSPLVTPFRLEPVDLVRARWYTIEAIAPAGTTLDGARGMLRKVLVERLGFQYHLADREEPAYFLMRGNGKLKLVPATELDPPRVVQAAWLFTFNSVSIASFARFLSTLAFCDVIDKTGIQGNYKFDIDLRNQLGQDMRENGPALAIAEAKRWGLRLEGGKEMRKVLVIDHLDKRPTPN